MAGLGYKTWATNESMSSVDLNGYIAEQIVPYFATNSARDVGIPLPEDGQVAYSAEFGELYRYQKSTLSWVSVLPRTMYKDADNARTTTTYFSDPDMQWALEASSLYIFECTIIYTADTGSDMKVRWAQSPGGFINNAYWTPGYLDVSQTSGNNVPLTLNAINMSGGEIFMGGGGANVLTCLAKGKIMTDTAGTLILQYACNVAGNCAAKIGSFASFWKVS